MARRSPSTAARPSRRSTRAAVKGPTTVLLVRHGRTATTGSVLPGRAPGLHLGEEGSAQAEAAATRIAGIRPAAVYASPMERTRETAAPISRAAGLRTRTAAGLTECDFGDWTGKRLSALRRKPEWSAVQHNPSTFRFPGGESFAEMQLRIWSELGRLASGHRGETIVAVSHADPIKAAVAMAVGVHLDNFQRLVVSPCSVSALVLGAGAPIVLSVNDTGSELGLAVS